MKRVRIKVIPKAKDGVETKAKTFNGNQQNWPLQMNQFSTPMIDVNSTLKPVDRSVANLEAEKGEHAVVNQDGLTTNFKVGGKRHSEGGTPLNLPKNSFIFSDTKDMKIKDPIILAQFGITTGVHTPADIAKKYDINKYRATLADTNSSDLDRDTAEMMISNYNLKLAKLALVQESKKGFPQGIPAIAIPYIESMEINPADFLSTQAEPTQFNPDMAQMGMETQIKTSLQKKSAEELAYKKETEKYFLDAMRDSEKAKSDVLLRNLYAKMQEKYKSGDVESKWYEMLPGVDPSAESYLELFKSEATKYGYNPSTLMNQYDIETGYVKPASTATPKMQAKTTPTITPSKEYEVELTAEEAAALGIKSHGGVQEYQQGGGTGKKKYKLTPEQLLKLESMRQKTPSSKVSKPTTKGVSTPPASQFDAYGQSLAELESYLVPGASLRKGKVSTKQSETTKGSGLFGDTEVSVDQFIKNNPGFAADFKAKHPGESYDPKNEAHVESFQNYYNPNLEKNVYDQLKKRGMTDEKAKEMASVAVNEFGFKKGEHVKDFDKKHGQFTGSRMELQFKEPDVIAATEEVKATPAIARTPVARTVVPPVKQQGHDPWWLQDIIKTAGAATDFFGVKKYSPWQATPGVTLAEPTFYDPTRELAANAEFANIGTQGLATFTNPQAFAAGFSQIQGQAGKNAADILGKYNNLNVGVANDFEIKNNDIMNQSAATLAGLSTQLADKYTILNQQFDNSKNMARQNIRQSYIDAITNKNYTANMNDLYDQYKVDPIVGGRIKWTHGRPLTPGDSNPSVIENINSAATEFMKMNPGLTRDKAFEAAMKMYGSSEQKTTPGYDPRGSAYPG